MIEPSVYHRPVMLEETAQYLVSSTRGVYVDGTLGGGGHAEYLLERFPDIAMIGIDRDAAAIEEASRRLSRFGQRVRIVRENFLNIDIVLSHLQQPPVDGVLLDLGVSSRQLEDPARGFSFASPVLDMRMDQREREQAEDLLNTLDEAELADLFYRYGEERRSRPISRRIAVERRSRRITSGEMLSRIVESVKPRRGKTHPATQVFQALRIAVNRETESLENFLTKLPGALASGGRAVILTYHSLEDRIVKQSFRAGAKEGRYVLLNKKVVCASSDERRQNPRSRSAKLRAMEKRP